MDDLGPRLDRRLDLWPRGEGDKQDAKGRSHLLKGGGLRGLPRVGGDEHAAHNRLHRTTNRVGATDMYMENYLPEPPSSRHLQAATAMIPIWYQHGMSRQIAVRLPDELVKFVDEIVDNGSERSRAAVVTRALERERRRVTAARDAEILAASGADPELAGLAEHVVGVALDD